MKPKWRLALGKVQDYCEGGGEDWALLMEGNLNACRGSAHSSTGAGLGSAGGSAIGRVHVRSDPEIKN